MEDMQEYAAEFNAFERTHLTIPLETPEEKTCALVAHKLFDQLPSKFNVSSDDLNQFKNLIHRISFINYKNPAGLFLGWIVHSKKNLSSMRIYIANLERDNAWPEKVQPISILNIVRYVCFWDTFF